MTELPEADWEHLNAYHDGELPAAERATLDRRLAAEPDLAAALVVLRTQSQSLARMKPQTAAASTPRRRPRLPWVAAVALAASLAIAFVLVAPIGGTESPASVHRTFAARSFTADQGGGLQRAGLNGSALFPDLAPAGLTLVAERAVPGGEAAHYAGRNGCRATLFLGKGPFAPPRDKGIAYVGWTSGPQSVALLSEGMDEDRFAAIADYVRRALQGHRSDAIMAVREATRRARSCA